MPKYKSKLSVRLRKLREEKNLLQKDIANILNITTSAYGYYEQGKREPDSHVINFLADYYEVSSDYLFGRTNNKNSDYILNSIENSIITNINNLSPESKKELEKYIQLLKYKDSMDKVKCETSSASGKNTS
ncbi:transcriptional regulator with XRE-family HTH domain [Ruminiclostridium sufflavum DSM 19573]|uniref:Transcriptional regulator with XRE-family HTH domain n=1 Tax=Ruminiclostridium sufflavum DSM 19573 TaxID=1121337 RepID=A0A318XRF1_9FIRM|nr:helix-turn-helix transcriptional regulator [Ruminiclostridium sufflavum]PYG88696.1 transcriptional regulator with XRE-family HTH domain [Ruminiclostridium sufflavum DSM 19573]